MIDEITGLDLQVVIEPLFMVVCKGEALSIHTSRAAAKAWAVWNGIKDYTIEEI